ncbi:type VI secretion system lipoprotein TssJ [Bordetella genomosp. 8]|nr:type VI secretion system lipoprotein TssJ [Bordetella genomosp. 8]
MHECRRLAARLLTTSCLLACLAACGTAEVPDHDIHLRLTAAPDLNPDRDGRPSPVIVRIYELAQSDDFCQADFFDLYDNDKRILGKNLLSRSVLAVRPGQRLVLRPSLVPGTRYLAVFVAYRDIYRARWRAVVGLPDSGDIDWVVTLAAGSVAVAERDGKNDLGSWKEGIDVLEQ